MVGALTSCTCEQELSRSPSGKVSRFKRYSRVLSRESTGIALKAAPRAVRRYESGSTGLLSLGALQVGWVPRRMRHVRPCYSRYRIEGCPQQPDRSSISNMNDLHPSRQIDHDLYDLCDLYDLTRVAGWDPHTLHGLRRTSVCAPGLDLYYKIQVLHGISQRKVAF